MIYLSKVLKNARLPIITNLEYAICGIYNVFPTNKKQSQLLTLTSPLFNFYMYSYLLECAITLHNSFENFCKKSSW